MSTTRWLLLPIVLLAGWVAYGSAQEITEFALPRAGSNPYGITAGPDGNVWFADVGYATGIPAIGRITPAGVVTEFRPSLDNPKFIVTGPDGNLWFTQDDDGNGFAAIGRMTPAGLQTTFPLPRRVLGDIAVGSDGNLWFPFHTGAFVFTLGISRITPAGVVMDFPLTSIQSAAAGIAAGPDGALWFVAPVDRIGRITTAGVVTQFALPGGSAPTGIVAGPDGNLWFTEMSGNKIGRITTLGTVTEFPVPTAGSRPMHITSGPDGNLWFTESLGGKIGRITTAGVITEFPIPTPDSEPFDITPGPDGAMWFTETRASKIGRITMARAPAIDLRMLPVVGSTPGVGGSFFKTSVQLNNSTSTVTTGRIVFHPSGVSGSALDPALFYSLSPGQTQSIADLLPAMGRSGLGSADIEVTSGSVPAVSARVFNDAGAAGTTGFTEEPMRAEEALRPGQSGVLFLPADLTSFRFNVGVRTLEAGASATLTLRDSAGTVVATVSRSFPATYHEQQSASAFLGVATLPAGGSISIAVSAGAAIFYSATVDNRTGDPSLQIARAAP